MLLTSEPASDLVPVTLASNFVPHAAHVLPRNLDLNLPLGLSPLTSFLRPLTSPLQPQTIFPLGLNLSLNLSPEASHLKPPEERSLVSLVHLVFPVSDAR
jgi:hypothetical protein